MNKKIFPFNLSGTVEIPASKSDSQRAILCAALAKGKSVLYNIGKSNDEVDMLNAIETLGAFVKCVDNKKSIYEIDGTNFCKEGKDLELGESGLGSRLLIAVLSSFESTFRLNGKGSLVNRPMDFYIQNLPKLGVQLQCQNNTLPIAVAGPLKPKEITVDGSLSSQFISGLLMAFANTEQAAVLHVQDLRSVNYVKMTLKTLHKFGVEIESNIDSPTKLKAVPSIDDIYKHIMGITEVDVHSATDSTMTTFRIKAKQTYIPTQYKIESDWSSASYWIVAKMLGADIEINGLDLESLQADKKLYEQFKIENLKNKNFEFDPSLVEGIFNFEFDATDCPDLFPALAVLAAFQKSTSIIKGVNRLKHKESDRGEVLKSEFEKLGVKIELIADEMHIHGTGKVKGGTINAHNDHRIAMCFGIAALFADAAIEINGAEAAGKSYPAFWEDLNRLTNN
ncbi:MAG: 3-phosphoshikimate 1-carboxyvinyltransferase [Lishizhenia sp.]